MISAVTKGGGRDFHGSGWANKRHEMSNAKSVFQNYNGQQKSVYRFFVWGYSIGDRSIFRSCSIRRRTALLLVQGVHQAEAGHPQRLRKYADPGAVRDFSGCTDGNGVPFSLTDPTTGHPVPGNNIAGLMALNLAAAKAGQAILDALPLPNTCGHSGVPATGCIQDAQFASRQYQRNYYWSFNETHPRRNDTIRLDYNPTSKLTSWVRYSNDYDLDTTGSFDLEERAGPVRSFCHRPPEPGSWLRGRNHLYD